MSLSNSQRINLSSSIDELFKSKKSKVLLGLKNGGAPTLSDLLWILPLRVEKIPPIFDFSSIVMGNYFRGIGHIRDVQKKSSNSGRGKGNIPLQNVSVIVKDHYSNQFLTLRWFNSYPSVTKKIEDAEIVAFLGKTQEFNGAIQIVNPEVSIVDESEIPDLSLETISDLKIQYPTFNKIKGHLLKNVIDSIPAFIWENIQDIISPVLLKKLDLLTLGESFKILHGKCGHYSQDQFEQAKNRLIFEEFFLEQSKLFLRRKEYKKPESPIFKKSNRDLDKLFPFPLTNDQKEALNEIEKDMCSGAPMMRLIQGDVGCGKTWVAFAAALKAIDSGHQACIMCPTESLARQHYLEACEILNKHNISIRLLLGSTKEKEKKDIYSSLEDGTIQLVIGTHSLIQKNLIFKDLGLAVIDEQHKFGVNQRINLVSKGRGCHCLIMTATPIPRSLSLTQYGDLDITTIKSLPKMRSGYKTRIVSEQNFGKFLSFLKTRFSLGEQGYIVVPAIEESESLDLNNVQKVFERFISFFPELKIVPLHGKLNNIEKEEAFVKFQNGEIDLLIATSMVEVGINVTNATIMAILNPERFGLSSLHQLRGRVGRGEKPGFCFLVIDKKISKEAQDRLNFIEKNSDGFNIAEEDLRNRGQGDILGKDQSGSEGFKKLANPVIHYDLLCHARDTLQKMSDFPTPEFKSYLQKASADLLIHTTI